MVLNALIDMYAKCGSLKEAREISKMRERTVVSWTSMISGCAINGEFEEILTHSICMLELGIKTNHITLFAVLQACNHGGFIENGWEIYSIMTKVYNIYPGLDHYASMADLLARGGKINEGPRRNHRLSARPWPPVARNFRFTPMQPSGRELAIWVRGSQQHSINGEPGDENGFNSLPKRKDQNNIIENVIELSSSESEDEDTLSYNGSNQQLVLYDPSVNGGSPVEDFPCPVSYKPPLFKKILPSVGAFTVQCANCFKWRFIPNQKKYEEIREHIIEKPFVCATAHEWRPDVSCDDPPDIEQDGSRLWAIDKPNIVQPPPGWQRNLRIRGEGGTKFADIYYLPPAGKRVLRSIREVEKYLIEHPEYEEQGVTLAHFSFQVPKPLQEDYVRKRTSKVATLPDDNFMRVAESFQPSPDKALSLPDPYPSTNLQLCINPSPKKARSTAGKPRPNLNLMYMHHHDM